MQTSYYVIKIEGHLSNARISLFGNLEITPLSDGHTLISGQILDQSALFGVMLRIRDLGMPLISVNPINSTNLQEKSFGARSKNAEC